MLLQKQIANFAPQFTTLPDLPVCRKGFNRFEEGNNSELPIVLIFGILQINELSVWLIAKPTSKAILKHSKTYQLWIR